jgi:transposase-like protein
MASHGHRAAAVVAGAEEDVLAYVPLPIEHWTRIYSTNPLERLNEEGKRPHECGRLLPRRRLSFAPGGEHSDRDLG